MADYNVNMKQWNGTSFDNVFPLAYDAKQLGGQSLAEVKQWVHDNGLMMYTGQYMGTGTYGKSNPKSITFPFEVIAFIVPQDFTSGSFSSPSVAFSILLVSTLSSEYKKIHFDHGTRDYIFMKISGDRKTISWYSENSQYNQMNVSNSMYNFAAIGGYDMGGATEWTITQSGTWTVPRTGRYMLELYGGGGGTSRRIESSGYTGGASCQHYDSISLTEGEAINIVVGSGSKGQEAGGTTSFGSYSVSGSGGSSTSVAGSGAGNYGASGKRVGSNETANNYGTGKLSTTYGFGASTATITGGNGAVYLKYLGA